MTLKKISLLLMSLFFLSQVSCGKKDSSSTTTSSSNSFIGMWGGCVKGEAAQNILNQFGLNSTNDSKCVSQSVILAVQFIQENSVFGLSFVTYCSSDCSADPSAQLTVGGVYSLGAQSPVVNGASKLDLTILSSEATDPGWKNGDSVYTLIKVQNSVLSIGDCFSQTCLDESSRATKLLTGAVLNPTQN